MMMLPFNHQVFWESILYNKTIWSIGFSNNRLYYLTTTGLNYFDINNGQNPIVGENLYSYFPNISFGGGSKVKIDKQGNVWTAQLLKVYMCFLKIPHIGPQ